MTKEKKQFVALGALGLMVVSVGAFQFMGGSPEPPKTEEPKKVAAPKKETAAEIAKAAIKNPDFANPLPIRDPFEISGFAFTADEKKEDPAASATADVPRADKKPEVKRGHSEFRPRPLPGNPEAGGTTIPPLEPPKPKFEYSLIGIVTGKSPSAVFADGGGNQRMVDLGQSVGDATVVSITRNFVKVRFNNETLVLKVGGNPNAK